MLRCQNCAVTYAKAHVNHGAGMDLATGEFTAPVSGSYYFQVRIVKLLEMGMDTGSVCIQRVYNTIHEYSSSMDWLRRVTRPG